MACNPAGEVDRKQLTDMTAGALNKVQARCYWGARKERRAQESLRSDNSFLGAWPALCQALCDSDGMMGARDLNTTDVAGEVQVPGECFWLRGSG